jgi:KEOPS complex subunit Cgi121
MIQIKSASGYIGSIEAFMKQILRFSKQEGIVVQAFDASVIFSDDHLLSATDHAKRAFEQGKNSTNSFALEILLYAAGERQIEKAIKKVGVKKGTQRIVFVLTSDLENKKKIDESMGTQLVTVLGLQGDNQGIHGDRTTLKRFGITDQELATIPEHQYGDLILEKIALVDVMKK